MNCTGLDACENPATDEPHECPYQAEINDVDDDEYCSCCAECEQECCDSI